MALSVVIVNWRNEADTIRCVRAVRGWGSLNPQIFVVDNESTESSRAALAEVVKPDELICSEVNLGYGGGNNLGIRRALEGDAAHILLLNSDAEIAENAVRHLIERLETHPEISILGPVIRERSEEGEQCYIGGRDIALSTQTRIAAEAGDLDSHPRVPVDRGGLRARHGLPGEACRVRADWVARRALLLQRRERGFLPPGDCREAWGIYRPRSDGHARCDPRFPEPARHALRLLQPAKSDALRQEARPFQDSQASCLLDGGLRSRGRQGAEAPRPIEVSGNPAGASATATPTGPEIRTQRFFN